MRSGQTTGDRRLRKLPAMVGGTAEEARSPQLRARGLGTEAEHAQAMLARDRPTPHPSLALNSRLPL